MFKAANPYDEVVIKATDENLTSENWQLNLEVCDKVSTEGETGARNCVAAILKRLVHRNANVQLYALTLADALSKNCGLVAHRELASRSFCQTLQRIVTDRNTHATVKRKGISLIKEWSSEWGKDETLGIVRETMSALKTQGERRKNLLSKENLRRILTEPSFSPASLKLGFVLTGISFRDEQEEPQSEPSSEQLRKEDEELRRVLELSLQDQGGRSNAASKANAQASTSSSSSALATGFGSSAVGLNKTLPDPTSRGTSSSSAAVPAVATTTAPGSSSAPVQNQQGPSVSRVRALYDFTPTEDGELAFAKGDIIRVLDSVYEHWWRGELRGQAGIFPVNYVELLPDPTPAEVQREAELEARIFAQANDIDRLLSKLRGLDPSRDNLAEDEELQELYQSSLTMRPKIVKLIDRYNLKVDELRTMNDKFVRARSTYDAMMEQSLSKYQGVTNAGVHQAPAPYYSSAGQMGPNPAQYRADAATPQPHVLGQPYSQQQQQQHSHPAALSPGSSQAQQQQQEYAQAWASWYAQQQGISPQPQQYDDAGRVTVSQGHPHAQSQQAQSAAGAPSQPDQAAYSQWYYQQQQQQQQPQQHQQYQQPSQHLQSSASTAQIAAASSPAVAAGGEPGNDSFHDEEKRRMFERARAEADAWHRAHQQYQQSTAGSSTGAPSAPLAGP